MGLLVPERIEHSRIDKLDLRRSFDRTREEIRTLPESGPTKRDAFLLAANLIEQKGWCQGRMAVVRGSKSGDPLHPDAIAFCMLGAYYRANHDLGLDKAKGLLAEHRLVKEVRRYAGKASCWNDKNSTTKRDVVWRLRMAAERV